MRLRDFARSGHIPTLFSSFLYFDVSCMVWVLMGVLGAYAAGDLGLSAVQKGLMAAVPVLGGSLVRIPLGILVDRVGPRKTGIYTQLFIVLPLLGAWFFASSFSSILAFGFLLGIAGGSFAVALPLASRWYPPQHQGIVMGIAGAGNSGTVLASLFAPRLAEQFGWQNVFGLALIPVALTMVVYIVLAKESPRPLPAPKRISHYLSLLKEPDTLWFSFFYSITFGGFVGLASYLGIFFHDQYGLSKVMAGNVTAVCVLVGSIVRPVGGYWADRYGGIPVLSVFFGLIALFMLGVGFLPGLTMVVSLLFVALTCMGIGNGAVFQLVPQRFRTDIGVATGIVGAAGGIGGFFLPTVLGLFQEITGSYAMGFASFALASLGALVALRIVQRGWSLSWLTRGLADPTVNTMEQAT